MEHYITDFWVTFLSHWNAYGLQVIFLIKRETVSQFAKLVLIMLPYDELVAF